MVWMDYGLLCTYIHPLLGASEFGCSCGSLSLLFMMKRNVWHVSDSHKVMTAHIFLLSLKCCDGDMLSFMVNCRFFLCSLQTSSSDTFSLACCLGITDIGKLYGWCDMLTTMVFPFLHSLTPLVHMQASKQKNLVRWFPLPSLKLPLVCKTFFSYMDMNHH